MHVCMIVLCHICYGLRYLRCLFLVVFLSYWYWLSRMDSLENTRDHLVLETLQERADNNRHIVFVKLEHTFCFSNQLQDKRKPGIPASRILLYFLNLFATAIFTDY